MNTALKAWGGRAAWLLLVAVAGASAWLVIANQGGGEKTRPSAAANNLPDYSLGDAAITRYMATGRRRYILHAHRIVHLRASRVSRLTDIVLNYYPPAAPYWHLRADRGKLAPDGDRVNLAGHVRAHQPKAAAPLHLATSRMTVRLHERHIRSTARVRLRQGARTSEGVGLRGDLASGVVTLLHDVTSRYAY